MFERSDLKRLNFLNLRQHDRNGVTKSLKRQIESRTEHSAVDSGQCRAHTVAERRVTARGLSGGWQSSSLSLTHIPHRTSRLSGGCSVSLVIVV